MTKKDEEVQKAHQTQHLLDANVHEKVILPFWRQLVAASPPVIASISSGMIYGYSATLIPELRKPDSEIHVTMEVASWIASAVPLLMSINCIIAGPIMEKYGRRKAHFILCVPKFIGWITIAIAPNFAVLIIGRILGGISSGLLAPLFPTYLGEISEPKYRGFFLATPSISLTFGIFLTHVLGTFFNWRVVALFASIFPLITLFVLYFVPETPCWLLRKDRIIDASKSFRWLRGKNLASTREFEQMVENHKNSKNNNNQNDSLKAKIITQFKRPEFVKPLGILFCCFFVSQFSGFYIIAFYSVNILEKVLGANMNEYLVMNSIDALRLIMVLTGGILLRVMRRRVLMYISGTGCTISLLSLASYLFAVRDYPTLEDYSWIAVVALVFYIFFVSIGIFILPYCMTGELYPIDCRSIGSSLTAAINYLLFFIVIKTGPIIFENIGMHGMFLLYGCVCLAGTIVLGIILPETKNKTLVDIEMYFIKKKVINTDQKSNH